ncbi:transcription-repair coupling factor (superfamily II helicase) [Mumia flava]|uniref:Transcription-repair-coupling factor n=1 Tax=Mumia flava TaxID=1348852 RepID=A0A0B2BFV5_9ACTN|nr:transcription-repair coupling factor [Mumia flava]PJJ56850.1 transcription-repair coupling factor (superfamily II helicase) [Mumia flava]
MTLHALAEAVAADPTLAHAVRDRRDGVSALDLSAPPSLRPFLAGVLAGEDAFVLAVTATVREAEQLETEIGALVGPDEVALYPAWETLPHERLSPRSDTVGRRLAVLRRLVHPGDTAATGPVRVLVAPIRSVLQPQVRGLADLEPVELRRGDEIALDDVVRRLVDAAYDRVDLVTKRGELAVRGGIVDVFPPTADHPVRVEFFGDEVDELRHFSVADQRSTDPVDRMWAPPCRELLLTDDVRGRARDLAAAHPELGEMLDKIAEGQAVEGMESLAPVLVDGMELLVDLVPDTATVLVCDPERVRARAHDLVATSEEFLGASWAAAAGGGQAPIDLGAAAYRSLADVRLHTLSSGRAWWSTSPFLVDEELGSRSSLRSASTSEDSVGRGASGASDRDLDERFDAIDVDGVNLPFDPTPAYRGEIERALVDVKGWLGEGHRVVLLAPGEGQAARGVEVLGEHDVPARFHSALAAEDLTGHVVHVACGDLEHGFVARGTGLVVLTQADLVGQTAAAPRDERTMPRRRKKQIDPLELTPGDHVVHEQHGVGRYVEMMQRQVQGATREYLVIEYAASKRGQPPDRLFVPTDQLDQVTRYVGGEQPSLDRLGGSDWNKRKSRARKAVRQIADGLIKLYAARQATKGHAFAADTPWQRELEDAFPFHETPDQLVTIDEVKRDMERPVPMDRLVCGDVGYGKTEIAVRAAFKAIQDGLQVIVLVPTTLLVQQHFATFAERYAQFPVTMRALSRFQTDKEAKQVLAGLEDGSVDLVIGTHRLLQPGVKIPKLGLVIVDEEQRFGVEHKEALKQLRAAVDVLSMSATPIPRTLEMAVTGIREMSTIQTPPEERHPVLGFVGAYDERQVAAALRRELLRDGQAFFIHNRVSSMDKAVKRLSELVPEARIAAAHGQMGEHRLEQIMVDFWEKKYDVLVCTTIVESGLDVSNANTMIVERADTLGLSQLHQLRGRVGRSRERAYAYFLYPPDKPLTETAHERLSTIAQHSELGGGMAIAMKDLEIRGAGNLLGGEQSGHIADVGFDLYVRLVGEAVAEYRGDHGEETAEVKLELPVDAHLPHDYVQSERLRLEMYKQLAAVRTDAEVDDVREELVDRYGEPPAPVDALLDVARLRVRARDAGVTELTTAGNNIRITGVDLPESRQMRLKRVYPGSVVKPQVKLVLVPRPKTKPVGGQPLRDAELMDWCRTLIDTVIAGPPAA